MPSFQWLLVAVLPILSNASPINRQVGISENVFITTQNGTDGLEQRVCSIDAVTYMDGETIPTSSPCEHCVCRPPGFACTITSCEYRPGCKAFRRSDQCCPEYQCECEKDGKIYQNGEKIQDNNNPCEVCYCQGGEIICAVIDCYWRNDCPPRYIDNRCCPMYDHCPPPSAQGPIRHRLPSLSSPITLFNLTQVTSQPSSISTEAATEASSSPASSSTTPAATSTPSSTTTQDPEENAILFDAISAVHGEVHDDAPAVPASPLPSILETTEPASILNDSEDEVTEPASVQIEPSATATPLLSEASVVSASVQESTTLIVPAALELIVQPTSAQHIEVLGSSTIHHDAVLAPEPSVPVTSVPELLQDEAEVATESLLQDEAEAGPVEGEVVPPTAAPAEVVVAHDEVTTSVPLSDSVGVTEGASRDEPVSRNDLYEVNTPAADAVETTQGPISLEHVVYQDAPEETTVPVILSDEIPSDDLPSISEASPTSSNLILDDEVTPAPVHDDIPSVTQVSNDAPVTSIPDQIFHDATDPAPAHDEVPSEDSTAISHDDIPAFDEVTEPVNIQHNSVQSDVQATDNPVVHDDTAVTSNSVSQDESVTEGSAIFADAKAETEAPSVIHDATESALNDFVNDIEDSTPAEIQHDEGAVTPAADEPIAVTEGRLQSIEVERIEDDQTAVVTESHNVVVEIVHDGVTEPTVAEVHADAVQDTVTERLEDAVHDAVTENPENDGPFINIVQDAVTERFAQEVVQDATEPSALVQDEPVTSAAVHDVAEDIEIVQDFVTEGNHDAVAVTEGISNIVHDPVAVTDANVEVISDPVAATEGNAEILHDQVAVTEGSLPVQDEPVTVANDEPVHDQPATESALADENTPAPAANSVVASDEPVTNPPQIALNDEESFDIILNDEAPAAPETSNLVREGTSSNHLNVDVEVEAHNTPIELDNDNDTIEIVNLSSKLGTTEAPSIQDETAANDEVAAVTPQISELHVNYETVESETHSSLVNFDDEAVANDEPTERLFRDGLDFLRDDLLHDHVPGHHGPDHEHEATTARVQADDAEPEASATVAYADEVATTVPSEQSRNKVQKVAEALTLKNSEVRPSSVELPFHKFRLDLDTFRAPFDSIESKSNEVAQETEVVTPASAVQDEVASTVIPVEIVADEVAESVTPFVQEEVNANLGRTESVLSDPVQDETATVRNSFRTEDIATETNDEAPVTEGVAAAVLADEAVPEEVARGTVAPARDQDNEIQDDEPVTNSYSFRMETFNSVEESQDDAVEVASDSPVQDQPSGATEAHDSAVTEADLIFHDEATLPSVSQDEAVTESRLRLDLDLPAQTDAPVVVLEDEPAPETESPESRLRLDLDLTTEAPARLRLDLDVQTELPESKLRLDLDLRTDTPVVLQDAVEPTQNSRLDLVPATEAPVVVDDEPATEASKLRLDIDTQTEISNAVVLEDEPEPTQAPSRFRLDLETVENQEPVTSQPQNDFVEVSTEGPQGFAKEYKDQAVEDEAPLNDEVAATSASSSVQQDDVATAPPQENVILQDQPPVTTSRDHLAFRDDAPTESVNDEPVTVPAPNHDELETIAQDEPVATAAPSTLNDEPGVTPGLARSGLDELLNDIESTGSTDSAPVIFADEPVVTTEASQSQFRTEAVQQDEVSTEPNILQDELTTVRTEPEVSNNNSSAQEKQRGEEVIPPKIQPISPDMTRQNQLRFDLQFPTEKDTSWLSRAVNQFRRLAGFSNGDGVEKDNPSKSQVAQPPPPPRENTRRFLFF